MITLLKINTLLIAITLPFMANLNAKEIKPKKSVPISKAFMKTCEKKSIENPYSDMRVVIDKKGNLKCKGFIKYAKPHCPDGYAVLKKKCVKVALNKK